MTKLRLFCKMILTLLALDLIPALGIAPLLAATPLSASEAKHKINLAGRQRMLSQRMAMLSCMADSDVQAESAVARAGGAFALFDQTLNGLRFGDAEHGLSTEKNMEMLDALAAVDLLWQGYGRAVEGYVTGGEAASLRVIHARNPAVLKTMNDAVGLMERLYGEGLIAPDLAAAINVAGRQRMLIMKALKEACMVGRGFDPEGDRRALQGTIALFSSSLYKLRVGNAWDGIIAPPSFEIDMQLELVQAVWDWMEPYLKEIAAGGPADPARLSELLYHGEVALREMNVAVGLYEKV
ncbi:Type IV pili methyl-accepting chemotaxis transducer N-term [Pseudooceanicola antarcticus]|uniref:Type IV pili methyl-accepting chemotaxis transducer N-term n=1 Tax=Pseudooceanicola antarcticus TaxID=1247613 RepID=A0A285J6W8_9RHOB|nr:type IV pili methyl-accepting chemotaxis transducer N-terminal domain-containing protein [Pseudooceanicola antarcticus]PJE26998.1 hypothetical protein CVM39_16870 [Pseudooceanicola antarcticus]SNY56080.1 Type IV pili methyl-accepting chemotaxis transducer N-term [Pseudooceanicola antarcticus]